MQAHVTRTRSTAVLIALALIVAACGADDSGATPVSPPDESTRASTASPTATAPTAETSPTADSVDGGVDTDSEADHDHEDDAAGHAHMDATVEATDDMTLEIVLTEETGDWLVELVTTGFTFAPDAKDGPHVAGQGHAHLYVDGAKVETLLGPTYTLEGLEPGERTIAVDLRSNDHALYELDGRALTVSRTITVRDGEAASDADVRVQVEFGDGSDFDDLGRIETAVGDLVEIVVSADVDEEVHVHGFDVFGAVVPGEATVLRFEPDAPGIYEVEMEGSGRLLFELLVNG